MKKITSTKLPYLQTRTILVIVGILVLIGGCIFVATSDVATSLISQVVSPVAPITESTTPVKAGVVESPQDSATSIKNLERELHATTNDPDKAIEIRRRIQELQDSLDALKSAVADESK